MDKRILVLLSLVVLMGCASAQTIDFDTQFYYENASDLGSWNTCLPSFESCNPSDWSGVATFTGSVGVVNESYGAVLATITRCTGSQAAFNGLWGLINVNPNPVKPIVVDSFSGSGSWWFFGFINMTDYVGSNTTAVYNNVTYTFYGETDEPYPYTGESFCADGCLNLSVGVIYKLNVDGVTGMSNQTDILNVSCTTSSTTTTTTLPPQCQTNANCSSGYACINGVCVPTQAVCTTDAGCAPPTYNNHYCDTRIYGVNDGVCVRKFENETTCYKEHECKSGDCTAEDENVAAGKTDDYPASNDYYTNHGFCLGLKEPCNQTSDCTYASVNYCQFMGNAGTYPLGFCQNLSGINQYCTNDSECQIGMQCFNNLCQYTNYTGTQCDHTNRDELEQETPIPDVIWSVCAGNAGCGNANTCYCNSTDYCVPRNPTLGLCTYEDMCSVDGRCVQNYTCFPESYQCVQNIDCPSGQYCEIPNYICVDKKTSGNCTLNAECASGQCVGGVCIPPYYTTSTVTTIPSVSGYTLEVKTDKSTYEKNETLGFLRAYWRLNGQAIPNTNSPACTYSLSNTSFSLPISTTGSLTGVAGMSGIDYFYHEGAVRVHSNISIANPAITVYCYLAGSQIISNWTILNISGFQIGGTPQLTVIYPLRGGVKNTAENLRVRLSYSNMSMITDGTCWLYVDDVPQNILTNLSNGEYQTAYSYTNTGTFSYNVSCSIVGGAELSYKSTFTVTATPSPTTTLHGTTPTTLHGATTTLPPSSCSNHIKDGSETGIDCGGSCPACECSDERSMTCSARTGFTCNSFCNQTSGKCYEIPCLVDAQCPQILLWASESCTTSGCNTVVKNRVCYEGECRLSSCTIHANASTEMDIEPLSGVIYDEAGTYYYLMTCEGETNGFRITTGVPTHKQYKIEAAGNSPSIPASGIWKTFGTDGAVTSATIPALCTFTDDFRYAKISMNGELVGGSSKSNQVLDAKIFLREFNATEKPDTTNDFSMILTLNRNGTCYVRATHYSPYILVNSTVGMNFTVKYQQLTNTSSIEWLCNSTYGEEITGGFSHDGIWLTFWILGVIWGLVFGWIEWKPWYIMIVVLVLLIIIPLIILISRREGGNE